MPVSQAAREAIKAPWTLYAGDFVNFDVTPGSDVPVLVLSDFTLKRLTAVGVTLTTDSQFVIELIRGASTVLVTLTSAVPYVAGVVLDSGDVDIDLDKDETLKLRVRAGDADTDDFGALRIEGLLQLVRDQSDA